MKMVEPFTSSATSEITDNRYQYVYYTNGDFQTDGLHKQFMFYEYLPSGLSWDTLTQMTCNVTAGGLRCNYRVLGYRSGGGGTLIFDSGWGGQYGQAIDIQGAGFDYYNIILSCVDDTGQEVQVGNIDSAYVVFAYGELVQLPTTPPELVDGVQSIDDAINGGTEENVDSYSDSLPNINNSDIPSSISTSTFTTYFAFIGYIWSRLRSVGAWNAVITFAISCAIIGYVIYKGW